MHKAILVNFNYVAEFIPWFSGNYRIRMQNDTQTELDMSRRYAMQLKELTGWR